MEAKIWFNNNPNFLTQNGSHWPEDYTHVATLDQCSMAEDAFERTQNGYEPRTDEPIRWTETPLCLRMYGARTHLRSMSAGDVVEINGKAYLCKAAGWSVLEETHGEE